MTIRRIRNSWFVDFHFGGERCRKISPLNTRAGALAYEMFLRKEAGLHGSVGAALRANQPKHQTPCPTLNEFCFRWFRGYVNVNNRPAEQKHKRNAFERHLLPHFGHLRLCDIGTEEIESYKGKKRQECFAAKSINNHLAILHRCLISAKEWNVLRTEVPRIPALKPREANFRFLTEIESLQLLKAVPAGIFRTMVLMGLRTGMRYCELSGLHWSDVDLERKLATVSCSMVAGHLSPPKNGRIRHIPMTVELVEALTQLPRKGDYVFHQNGEFIHYSTAWRIIDAASRIANIEHVSWHDLRHTFASQLMERGASVLSVQKLLGHADIQITMRYSHLGKDALRDAVALLEKKGSPKSEVHFTQ